ncbi:hypothetical protein HD597_003094 [Nonomuraea thailandensis]|uniref:Uncharacterized protein n=1 Tax=Nonomuraea thailandensis TaxID=1188745 RepID=A0A9X2GEQ4_9ACTN|nr:hypothetical protein [Nonomuraea thailandensis]
MVHLSKSLRALAVVTIAVAVAVGCLAHVF